jgi:hypothetical protein
VTAYSPSDPAIHLDGNGDLTITNCNFAYNIGQNWFYTISLRNRVKAKFFNSIFYANEPEDIYVGNADPLNPDNEFDLELHQSLLEHGEASLKVWDTLSRVFFSPGNIEGDPLFKGSGEYPYQLLPGSPCQEAGTLNLPTGIFLPETDLAGNPRIFNELVDMGAYEYNEFVEIDNDFDLKEDEIRIRAFPNPFSEDVNIVATIPSQLKGIAGIYSLGGILLREWSLDSVENTLQWNGCTTAGNPVSPGIYLLMIGLDNGINSSKKIVIIR